MIHRDDLVLLRREGSGALVSLPAAQLASLKP